MKPKSFLCWKTSILCIGALAAVLAAQAQVNTNPVPNLAVSWSFNSWGFANAVGGGGQAVPNTAAGLALATNWNDSWEENYSATDPYGAPELVKNLFDITGAASSLSIAYNGYNGYSANGGGRPAQDADGSYNMQMLNGYLNTGPASWVPPITNSFVTISNIPYGNYDLVVYFSSDTSGRRLIISDGFTSNYCSTVGGAAEVEGTDALFLPANQTNSSQFPTADFAFFPSQTTNTITLTTYPLSGNDQWLGVASFQVIQASNVYVLYGPSPIAQTVPVGKPASFSVMAGGLTPQYQWQHAGTNLPNATNATYSIASTVAGQDGNYAVVVSNSFSSVTSMVAKLVFYTPKTDTWAGVGATWDTTSLDWTINGGASKTNYTETDNVLFSALGTAQPAVTLAGAFTPSSITVSNASYELTSGGIGGAGSLHVTGNGTLVLDTVDGSTGPTLIDSGSTLVLDNGDAAGALGSGLLTNNGALVFNSDGNYAYGFPIYGTGNITNESSANEITLGANINANYLVQAGAGQLLLQGSNNFTGGLVVSGGTVLARVSSCIGQGSVVLSGGGQLQLVFANDFTGTAMTLAGGVLQGGLNGNNSYDATVSLTTDSDIDVGANDTFTLNSVAGLNGGVYNFNVNENGAGTLILPGTGNTWASVTVYGGTLQIGNGAGASLGSGAITLVGDLTLDNSSNLAVTNAIAGSGAINQNGTGTNTLTADNNAAGFAGNINVNNGTLLINGTAGPGTVSVNAGALGGSGIIEGSVITTAGTLFAGGPASVGALEIDSGLAIGGNVLVKVNKSLAQSNDVFNVANGLINTGTGVVTVENLGPALAAGNRFVVFNGPLSGGGALAVTGGGAIWTNNLAVDGSISVIGAAAGHPVIKTATLSGGGLVASGTNGVAGGTYYVLFTTNLATPVMNWKVISTNVFDSSGDFTVTNSFGGGPQGFYIIAQP